MEEEVVDLHQDQQPKEEQPQEEQQQEQPQEELNFMDKPQVTVVGDRLPPSEKCSRRIYKIFQQKVDRQGANFNLVSSQTKKLYFEEFKKFFVWDSTIDSLVENAFYKKAKKRYADFVYDVRQKKPNYIPQSTWDEWDKWWKSPENAAKSKRNSKNRRCGKENEKAPSTHVCGSVTHATTEKRLEEKMQKKPTAYQLFVHAHTLAHNGEQFITDKAKDVNDKVLALMEERRAAGVENIDEDQIFFDVVGGKKRKRVYGVGQADYVHYPEVCLSPSVNQKDIDDRVTQKFMDLRPTLESEIRENIRAELREEMHEELTASISKSFEETFDEHKREMKEMKEMVARLMSQSKK